jgi:TPR repeat protein
MAADGFKVAEIAPQLLATGPARDRAAAKVAFERLRLLADSGDTSAMCFMPLAWSKSVIDEALSYDVILAYAKRGAALGHPYCQLVVARLYGSGADGFPKDLDRAMRLVREVAREGYWEAHVALFKTYAERVPAYDDLDTLRRTLCWGRLAQQYSNWTAFDSYNDKLRAFAVANRRPDLLELENEWDTRSIPVEVKRITPDDCLAMEPKS